MNLRRRSLIRAVILAATSLITLAVACVSFQGVEDDASPDARTVEDDAELSDASAPVDSAQVEDAPDLEDAHDSADARDEGSAGDAGDAGGPCTGKPNGTTIADAAAPVNRCCNGKLVSLQTIDNCGICGIKCGKDTDNTQFQCVRIDDGNSGQWACNCRANEGCPLAGYGSAATCYDTRNNPQVVSHSFCNCQCAAGLTSCKEKCADGATCKVVTGTNFCTYNP